MSMPAVSGITTGSLRYCPITRGFAMVEVSGCCRLGLQANWVPAAVSDCRASVVEFVVGLAAEAGVVGVVRAADTGFAVGLAAEAGVVGVVRAADTEFE